MNEKVTTIGRKIRSLLIRFKIILARSASWLSLANAGMILFLTLSKLKEASVIHSDLSSYFFTLYILGFVILFVMGYVEIYWVKGMQEEQNQANDLSPYFKEIKNKVNYLYEKELAKEQVENQLKKQTVRK